jgi:hypothetical protein
MQEDNRGTATRFGIVEIEAIDANLFFDKVGVLCIGHCGYERKKQKVTQEAKLHSGFPLAIEEQISGFPVDEGLVAVREWSPILSV